MAASKDKEVKLSGLQRLVHWMQYVPSGALLFAVAPLLILGYFAWMYWGAEHLDKALYAVKIENLVATPQPTWIRSSRVRDEVFKSGGLGQLSLLDPQASATIAHAFESHSWVQRATRVTKLAGGTVTVDLVYRRPLAMIHYEGNVASSSSDKSKKFLFYPVDEEGVILPTSDFDSSQVTAYFRIYAEGATSPSDEGMSYSDARIKQALIFCRLLESHRVELRLDRIYVVREDRMGGPSPWVLSLATTDQRRIEWGHAPGYEAPGEPPAQEKLAKLLRWRAEANSNLELDLTKPLPLETKLTGSGL